MPSQDQYPVKVGPGKWISVGFTGGGPVPSYYVPAFWSASAGGTLEVHFVATDGMELGVQTYTLPTTQATAVGVLALSRAGGTFLQDITTYKQSVGFFAYARGSNVNLGRCGYDLSNLGTFVNPYSCNPSGSFPEVITQNYAFAWCIIAGSQGWAPNWIEGSGSDTSTDLLQLYTLNQIAQLLQLSLGIPPNSTIPSGLAQIE